MTIVRKKPVRLSETTYRKLQERSGVLYSRALERWNQRAQIDLRL